MLEELERRGALRLEGPASGPQPDALRFVGERLGETPGIWLFLPRSAFDTGFDEPLA